MLKINSFIVRNNYILIEGDGIGGYLSFFGKVSRSGHPEAVVMGFYHCPCVRDEAREFFFLVSPGGEVEQIPFPSSCSEDWFDMVRVRGDAAGEVAKFTERGLDNVVYTLRCYKIAQKE